jgi:hypothetical protein
VAPASLLSQLSLLSCYLTAIDDRAVEWLRAVAPHTPVNHNVDQFIDQLLRLATPSPANTGLITRAVLEAYQPAFDFEDRLKRLITELAAYPESRADAILSVDRVRHLPGMVQLYGQLTSTPASAKA